MAKSKKSAKDKKSSKKDKNKTEEIQTTEAVLNESEEDEVLSGPQDNSDHIQGDDINPYDLVPYESYPYPVTHPTHLNTIATIFGVKTPDIKTARVLELGCAGGGNLMALANDFPDAEFVGIDLSKDQIERGKEHSNNLGLQNLTLEHLDITDFDDKRGKFDYIICHGVFSWVPDHVADKILEICEKQLTPEGIAVISYNCLPGWSAVRSVRDMMVYHTERFNQPEEKVKQARMLLDFLTENTPKNSPYHSILEHEKAILGRTNKDYIVHEYLEDVNKQYYFHEFMSLAHSHNLQYLGDTHLSSMFTGNMPQKAAEKLRAVNDIIQQEQYMDYIRNRRFRYTILTSRDREVKRKIEADVVYDLYIRSDFAPSSPIANDDTAVQFLRAGKAGPITISDAGTKAVFAKIAAAKGAPVKIEPIVNEVAKDYNLDAITLKNSIQSNIVRLALNGLIKLTTEPAQWVNKVSEKPKAYKLAQYQGGLSNQSWITNAERRRIKINRMTGKIISLADGSRTVPEIVDETTTFVKNSKLKVMSDGIEVTEPDAIRKSIENIVSNTLQDAAAKGIIIA